ncbi:MAG: hypothetical protein LLF78_04255 [Synergistaceae bacterium]|nr:hypothetical protein [Synergistaceae bacterium]
MDKDVEFDTAKGFIQRIALLVQRGYYFYCITKYPAAKQDKWKKIDNKLVEKYSANLLKYVTIYRKKKGLANFQALRYRDTCVLLHTPGIVPETYDDKFLDIHTNPLTLKVGDIVEYQIRMIEKPCKKGKDQKNHTKSPQKYQVDTILTNRCLRTLKGDLLALCPTRIPAIIVSKFAKLNRLLGCRSVRIQMYQIRDEVIAEAKKCGMNIPKNKLYISAETKFQPQHKKETG